MRRLPNHQRALSRFLAVAILACGAGAPALGQGSSLVRDETTATVRAAPEGTFLVRQRCEMRRLGTSGWYLVFARAEVGEPLAPMIVHPCANLQAMQQLAATERENSRFLVSGQVFLYEGRNYILPTLFALDDGAPDAQSKTSDGAPKPTAQPDAADPDIAELIARLEEASSREDLATPAAPAPEASGLLREGTMIASKPGRLERSDKGGWRLLFDADTDGAGAGAIDAPIELLACLNLEAMQEIAEHGAVPVFLVSGRVFIYDGQNYLLPTMFVQQRPRNTGLSTAQ